MTSRDGTDIAYERAGGGLALILVGGSLTDRAENVPLAAALAASFTVLNYDRRGRGASGDTPPYAVERELEDLDALITAAGGSAHLYGVSTGGALALRAAAAGLAVERVGVYEVPYAIGEKALGRWRAYVEALDGAGRSEALELFMRLAGSSEEAIAGARAAPVWPELEAIAHTLAYDAAVLGDGSPPGGITHPVLVATGGGDPYFERAADALAAGLPHAERHVFAGQGHVADPAAVAPVLARFLDQ